MQVSNQQIIIALLSEGTVSRAAERLGCSVDTIYKRQKKPDFQELYSQAKSEQIKTAAAKLQRFTVSAVDVTLSIMADKEVNPATRLQAAQTILSYSLKLTEQVDIIERLDALEKEINNDGHT